MNPMMVASAASSAVDATAWKPVLDALTAQLSVGTVVGVIASVVAAGVGLVFMWWGVRKAVKSLMSAFQKGKMSIG